MKTVLDLIRQQNTDRTYYTGGFGRFGQSPGSGCTRLQALWLGKSPEAGDTLMRDNGHGGRVAAGVVTAVELVGENRYGYHTAPHMPYRLIAKVEVEWSADSRFQPETEKTLAEYSKERSGRLMQAA